MYSKTKEGSEEIEEALRYRRGKEVRKPLTGKFHRRFGDESDDDEIKSTSPQHLQIDAVYCNSRPA
jgi:hypothetical protein